MKGTGIKIDFVLALAFLVLFCIVAVGTRAIGVPDMPASFLGAALGAVITAVVTQLLLNNQAKTAEEKERNVRIFELKKDAFTKYINKVWEIWADQQIDESEFEDLCSSYYKDIAMYQKGTTANKFIEFLTSIGECLGDENKDNYETLKKNVFGIINILVEDLGLGGKVDQEKHTDLLKKLFPGFFRKAIEKEIFNILRKKSGSFLNGKYEPVYDNNNEYLCFYFDTVKTAGFNFAKIIIGPFKKFIKKDDDNLEFQETGGQEISFYAEKEMDGWQPPNDNISVLGRYKPANSGWYRRIIQTKDAIGHIISSPIEDKEDNTWKDKDEYVLNFNKNNEHKLADNYLTRYPEVAKVLAKRVEKFFDKERIGLKDLEGKETGESLSIIDFMRRYKFIE